jgi:hypothetical protein
MTGRTECCYLCGEALEYHTLSRVVQPRKITGVLRPTWATQTMAYDAGCGGPGQIDPHVKLCLGAIEDVLQGRRRLRAVISYRAG